MEYSHLITLVERYCAHVGRREATISNQIAGHARLFLRLREGFGCTVVTFKKALAWFDANWPEDLAWPSDIPRPSTKKEDAA
jgi:hypothetical protein